MVQDPFRFKVYMALASLSPSEALRAAVRLVSLLHVWCLFQDIGPKRLGYLSEVGYCLCLCNRIPEIDHSVLVLLSNLLGIMEINTLS